MMNIMHFYEAGKARSGTALVPINGSYIALFFSTRNGNAVVDWGDGTTSNWTTPKNNDATLMSIGNISHSYAANYNGNVSIKFIQGLKDVYSFTTTVGSTSQKLNISDFGAFINQFPKLYSIKLQAFAYNVQADMGVIKGDLGNIPASVERYVCESFDVKDNATDVWFNFSSLPIGSNLKYLDFSGEVGAVTRRKILGNLANLPVGCYFCKFSRADNSSITYTAGKVWASSFDTLSIPVSLSHTELDNLLIDMNNSITTKIGDGVISLSRFRSAISDSAVASLQAKGFTVNVRVLDTVLKMPLSADLVDTSSYLNHATMVGTANYTGGALNTSTGNYAYIPNKTSLDFGTGSLYFGCKVKFNTAPTSTKGLMGKTIATGISGRFGLFINSTGNITALTELGSVIQNSTPAGVYADGNFHSIEAICDRTKGEQLLYIDGVLINTTTFTPSNNNIAVNARFNIGAYGNATGNGILASSEFNGAIKDVFVHKF